MGTTFVTMVGQVVRALSANEDSLTPNAEGVAGRSLVMSTDLHSESVRELMRRSEFLQQVVPTTVSSTDEAVMRPSARR
jgi:hypothetical protein